MKLATALLLLYLTLIRSVGAQLSGDLSGGGFSVQTGKGASVASNTTGKIDPDVQMDGVTVINGEVFVDGERVPRGKSPYTSRKSGKTYNINWCKDGNVSVQEK